MDAFEHVVPSCTHHPGYHTQTYLEHQRRTKHLASALYKQGADGGLDPPELLGPATKTAASGGLLQEPVVRWEVFFGSAQVMGAQSTTASRNHGPSVLVAPGLRQT